MANEFKPLVPSTFKGKATFSISNNRINRVAATSGTSSAPNITTLTPLTVSQPPTRGNEVAKSPAANTPCGAKPKPARSPNTAQSARSPMIRERPLPPKPPTPIAPRNMVNIGRYHGPSQKIVFNTSGTKFILVNGTQLKPVTLKRAGDVAGSPVQIVKRAKPFTPILPYSTGTPSQPSTSSNYPPGTSADCNPTRSQPAPALPKQPLTSALDGGIYPRPKKPCNCTKSMCLKLYCDCFANGEFCNGCNCQNCHNNIQHESERSRSIKTCLERNPYAFHPKIGKTFQGHDGATDRHHSKGCHCKRSGCLKNYCECYEAKIPCSSLCKCVGCKNYSQSHSTLQQLADVAVVRHQQQHSVKQKFNSQLQDMNNSVPDLAPLDNLNLDCLSMNLSAATARCLLSAASHAVDHFFSMETIEKAIIEEFGQCLNKIIEKGTKKKEGGEEGARQSSDVPAEGHEHTEHHN